MRIRFAVFLFLLTALGGCAGPGARLDLHRVAGWEAFSQRFDQAYIAMDDDGDYDIVFIHHGMAEGADKPGDILHPVDRLPVRHVVHAHVFWRSRGGARRGDFSTSNAAVNWYVFTTGAAAGDDVLTYRGAGFVGIRPDEPTARITMRNVRVSPGVIRGAMTDPIGEMRISGHGRAVWDRQYVAELLGELSALSP